MRPYGPKIEISKKIRKNFLAAWCRSIQKYLTLMLGLELFGVPGFAVGNIHITGLCLNIHQQIHLWRLCAVDIFRVL